MLVSSAIGRSSSSGLHNYPMRTTWWPISSTSLTFPTPYWTLSCAIYERDGFIFCELTRIVTVKARSDKDSLHSSLGDHRSVQIPYGRYRYYVVVALRLNYKLPSTDRIGVECDGVYPSIPACLRDTHILAFAAEYLA